MKDVRRYERIVVGLKSEVTIIGAGIIDVLAGPVDESVFEKGSQPVNSTRLAFGGDALNEAVVLSQLGAQVELISKVGNDEAGKRVLDFLQEKRVDVTKVKTEADLETGINIVLVTPDGERMFLTNPNGSLRKLSEADVMEQLKAQLDYQLLTIQYPFEDIEGLISLLTDVLTGTETSFRINGTSVPAHQLRDRIRKLSYEHIAYVLDGLQNMESPIKNMRAFLLTALYNAPGTMALYYTNAIRQREE